MQLTLPSRIQKLIDERVKSGQYGTAEDVIAAALVSLEQNETFGDFAPGELDVLIARGERDIEQGKVLDGEQVFAELRRRSDEHRSKARRCD